MKALVAILFICCFTCAMALDSFGQNNNSFFITASPLSLVDPVSGVFEIGIQKRINYKIAVALNIGIKCPLLSLYYRNNERKNYRYFKSRLDFKYSLKSSLSRANLDKTPYLGLQLFLFPQSYTKTTDYIFRDTTSYSYEKSNINRKVWAMSLTVGYETRQRRVLYDMFAGLGVRSIRIRQNAQGLMQAFPPSPLAFHFTALDRHEGNFLRLNLVAGFKIGYQLF